MAEAERGGPDLAAHPILPIGGRQGLQGGAGVGAPCVSVADMSINPKTEVLVRADSRSS